MFSVSISCETTVLVRFNYKSAFMHFQKVTLQKQKKRHNFINQNQIKLLFAIQSHICKLTFMTLFAFWTAYRTLSYKHNRHKTRP